MAKWPGCMWLACGGLKIFSYLAHQWLAGSHQPGHCGRLAFSHGASVCVAMASCLQLCISLYHRNVEILCVNQLIMA